MASRTSNISASPAAAPVLWLYPCFGGLAGPQPSRGAMPFINHRCTSCCKACWTSTAWRGRSRRWAWQRAWLPTSAAGTAPLELCSQALKHLRVQAWGCNQTLGGAEAGHGLLFLRQVRLCRWGRTGPPTWPVRGVEWVEPDERAAWFALPTLRWVALCHLVGKHHWPCDGHM